MMTPETLAAIAALILSLIFSYLPRLRDWYETILPEYKRLLMLALLLVVAASSYVLACAGLAEQFGVALTCDQPGLIGLVKTFVAALVANQALFLISPKAAKPALG